MSRVIWVLTSNDCRQLPAPLLSRCPPVKLRNLSQAELADFLRREGVSRELSVTATEAIVEVLAQPRLRNSHPSLRTATRMLQHAADRENASPLH